MLPFCSFHMYLHTPTMMKSSITVSRPTVVKLVLFLSEGVVCSICFVLGIDFLDNLQKVLEQDFKSFSILNYTKFYFNKWNVSGFFFITDGRHYNARIITQSTWTIDMLVIMLLSRYLNGRFGYHTGKRFTWSRKHFWKKNTLPFARWVG